MIETPALIERFERHGQPREREVAPATAQQGKEAEQSLEERVPRFAVPALRCVDDENDNRVDGNQDAAEDYQSARQPPSAHVTDECEDEDREVQQKDGIGQVADHLPGHPAAFGIMLGQQAETGVEPAAALAGVNQGQIKWRDPIARVREGLAESEAGGNFLTHPAQRFLERAGRRMAFQLFERTQDGQAGGGELRELMIKFRAPVELAGCDDGGGGRHWFAVHPRKSKRRTPYPPFQRKSKIPGAKRADLEIGAPAAQAIAPSSSDFIFALPPAMPTCWAMISPPLNTRNMGMDCTR